MGNTRAAAPALPSGSPRSAPRDNYGGSGSAVQGEWKHSQKPASPSTLGTASHASSSPRGSAKSPYLAKPTHAQPYRPDYYLRGHAAETTSQGGLAITGFGAPNASPSSSVAALSPHAPQRRWVVACKACTCFSSENKRMTFPPTPIYNSTTAHVHALCLSVPALQRDRGR